MNDIIQKYDYFAIEIKNKPGAGARVLRSLKDAGVNLAAFTCFPRGKKAQMDIIVDDAAALKAIAKKDKLELGPRKKCFVIHGEDRVGALSEILAKLAEAKINVTACDAATAGMERYGAILWVKPRDVKKAGRILGVSTVKDGRI
jgi:hypothetical protein